MTDGFKMEGGVLPQLTYSAILPLFFLGSALLYNPFDIRGYYSFGDFSSDFHLVMLSCIILLCSAGSRTALGLILGKHDFKWPQYGLWCLGELALASAFAALYTVLFKGMEEYFRAFADCGKFICLILIYPYLFMALVRLIRIKDEELSRREKPADNSLIRFLDEHKRLKLSIVPSSILYVKSEFNYVRIYYLDGNKVRDYMLRASMKSLESIDSKSLVRCQRSYFVNPEHISVLRKEPEGFIFAEMNIPDLPEVPVSKQYYDNLSSLL